MSPDPRPGTQARGGRPHLLTLSAAGNSHSRRSAAPFDQIRGRELTGRSAFSLIFMPQNIKFLKNRPSFTFFQKTAPVDSQFSAFKARICALRAADQSYQTLKSALDSHIDRLQPRPCSIQKRPKFNRRRQFLKNRPSFTFFQKTYKTACNPHRCHSFARIPDIYLGTKPTFTQAPNRHLPRHSILIYSRPSSLISPRPPAPVFAY